MAAEATEARDVKAKAADRVVTVQAEIVVANEVAIAIVGIEVAIVAVTGASTVHPKSISRKLIQDSLYLDNQAHAVVAECATWIPAPRASCGASTTPSVAHARAETDKQHQFVMLRARLAYTIARHQLRSLDILEKLLLQVTRKNDVKGYERFRDLFEAIVAYNE